MYVELLVCAEVSVPDVGANLGYNFVYVFHMISNQNKNGWTLIQCSQYRGPS
jgi:hypothetical protein